ncbi:HAMP domain-containing sensor histidine kinase [uncultured Rhodospira sp.]|uniref:sensor histidine kinase n=1 Tax=uncultured Rhodospira sp. TaxID=1936189 RepID=UPI002636B106|nr:HAMP domain-containing sensor histidine kinase [uncultured Rhodospira sp.]
MVRLSLSSVRLRLMAAGAVSIAAALVLAGLGLALLFERHVERRAVAELSDHLDQVIAGLDRTADGALIETRLPADPRFGQPLSGLYWQVNAGTEVLRSRSLWDSRLTLPDDVLADGQVHEHTLTGPAGEEVLTLERRVTLPDRLGGTAARVAVALDRADLRAATAAFVTDLMPYLAVLGLGLIAASWVQITVGLRPLAAIRARVEAVRSGRATRLGTDFPDEVRPLAAEVDGLLAAREEDVRRARARAADLAHGLKTPLQVLAGDVERLRARGETVEADEIEQVATAMRRHVERELARARLAAGITPATCRPAEVVDRVVGVVRRTPDGARLTWRQEVPTGLVAPIDADDLTEVLGALIENAARHAGSTVTVAGWRDGEGVVLSVADDGPGIPAERRAVMLDRGQRLDMAGDGSGLGLAIAQDILAAWGGTLVLDDAPSGGLMVRLTVAGS